jgi:hypothetical protein
MPTNFHDHPYPHVRQSAHKYQESCFIQNHHLQIPNPNPNPNILLLPLPPPLPLPLSFMMTNVGAYLPNFCSVGFQSCVVYGVSISARILVFLLGVGKGETIGCQTDFLLEKVEAGYI